MTEPWNGKHTERSVREWAEGWRDEQGRSASSRPTSSPDFYDEGRSWLRRRLQRQRSAVITALLVSWTGVWLVPWGTVLGGLVGMLAAGGFATGWAAEHHLFEVGAGQAVSIVSLSLGLVLGALAGCVLTVMATTAANPIAGAVSIALGSVLTILVVVFVAALERPMLRLRGYRRLSRDEARRIAPLVRQVAEAMALDGLPRFAMSDALLPNAWTHMRTIVLTAGLLQMLEDRELGAVLAHELHHWRQGDAVGLRVLWAAALPTALVLNLGTWIAGSGATSDHCRPTGPKWPGARHEACSVSSAGQSRGRHRSSPSSSSHRWRQQPSVGTSTRPTLAQRRSAARARSPPHCRRSAPSNLEGRAGSARSSPRIRRPRLRIEALQPVREDDVAFQGADLGRPSFADLMRVVRSAL